MELDLASFAEKPLAVAIATSEALVRFRQCISELTIVDKQGLPERGNDLEAPIEEGGLRIIDTVINQLQELAELRSLT